MTSDDRNEDDPCENVCQEATDNYKTNTAIKMYANESVKIFVKATRDN